MKILFLHEVNYLTKPIFEMHEIPESLVSLGDDVTFVHFPEGQSLSASLAQPAVTRIQGRVNRNAELDLVTPKVFGGSIAGRLIQAMTFYFQFRRILVAVKPDVVFSYSVPTSGWQALVACKGKKIPYMFRALDASSKIRRTVFSQIVLLAEKFIYQHADWISVNSPAMLSHVVSLGAKIEKASVDYPPLDASHFRSPHNKGAIKASLGLPPDSKVIVFMGSFFYFSGLPEAIMSFSRVRGAGEYLVLIGMGEQERELRSLVESTNLTQYVIFTGRIEYEYLPKYLSVGDVAINPFLPSMVSHTALPNKVLQYMAAELPVVSTRLEGLGSVFGEELDGLVFVEKPELVIEAALDLMSDQSKLDGMGKRNSNFVRKLFEVESSVRQIQTRMRSLKKQS